MYNTYHVLRSNSPGHPNFEQPSIDTRAINPTTGIKFRSCKRNEWIEVFWWVISQIVTTPIELILELSKAVDATIINKGSRRAIWDRNQATGAL